MTEPFGFGFVMSSERAEDFRTGALLRVVNRTIQSASSTGVCSGEITVEALALREHRPKALRWSWQRDEWFSRKCGDCAQQWPCDYALLIDPSDPTEFSRPTARALLPTQASDSPENRDG